MRPHDKTKPLSQQPWLFSIPKSVAEKKGDNNG